MVDKLQDALQNHIQNLRDVAEETAADIVMPPGSRVILDGLEVSTDVTARHRSERSRPPVSSLTLGGQ